MRRSPAREREGRRKLTILIEADASSLEIVCAAYLSQDPVLMAELQEGVDIHSRNQEALNLPERVVAKIFVFR